MQCLQALEKSPAWLAEGVLQALSRQLQLGLLAWAGSYWGFHPSALKWDWSPRHSKHSGNSLALPVVIDFAAFGYLSIAFILQNSGYLYIWQVGSGTTHDVCLSTPGNRFPNPLTWDPHFQVGTWLSGWWLYLRRETPLSPYKSVSLIS